MVSSKPGANEFDWEEMLAESRDGPNCLNCAAGGAGSQR